MSSLRVVVTFPGDAYDVEAQTAVLGELQQALKAQMGLNQRLSRLPELTLPGAAQGANQGKPTDEVALRVFLLEFPDAADAAAMLRALGGWYMRHPDVQVSLKADGPAGGTNLRLTSFSTVAYARAVASITDLMYEPDDAGSSP